MFDKDEYDRRPELDRESEPPEYELQAEQPPAASPAPAPPVANPSPTVVRCPNCGYNLTGATIGSTCPECGLVIGAGALHQSNLPTSGKAVASMTLGIVSVVGCFFYGLPSIICGPLAIVYARLVNGQLKRDEVHPSSKGMAVAGLVCGIIGTAFGLLGVGGMVWFFWAVSH